jgi:hypothetical protein
MEKTKKDLKKIAVAGIAAAFLIPLLLSASIVSSGKSIVPSGTSLVQSVFTSIVPSAFAAPTVHGQIKCTPVGTTQLNCQFNVSGLGGASTATATITATVSVTTGCINQGSKDQQPSGLKRSTSTVTETQTVNVDSGRATFDITTKPLDASKIRTCPDNMDEVFVGCATFSNVSIVVKPNSGPSGTFPVSGTFKAC